MPSNDAGPEGSESNQDQEVRDDVEILKFSELGLPYDVQKAVNRLNFTDCTEVQSQVLPYSLSQHDVCAQANTGTGKTAAFLTTILSHHIEYPLGRANQLGSPRSLILAPTRELTLQIKQDMNALSTFTDVRSIAVVGGKRVKDQRDKLTKSPIEVIIATPGRLIDFIRQGLIHLDKVEILVIDEADRMLDMGFIPDVRRIVSQTPNRSRRQTMFFSATFNRDVYRLVEQWMYEPIKVKVEPESIAAESIEQHFWVVTKEEKSQVLQQLIQQSNPDRTLIFVNRRSKVKQVSKSLRRYDINCEGLSGDLPQRKRSAILERFKSGKTKHIVATDVAGRGLHIEGISHVVNYDLPDQAEDYVHRIGRTGRAGASGISISFVSESDGFVVPEIGALLGEEPFCTPPDFRRVSHS